MSVEEFPVSKFYKDQVVDGETIERSGGWWSAALLIREPSKGELFVGLYLWQETSNGWKNRGRFKIRTGEQGWRTVDLLERYLKQMGFPQGAKDEEVTDSGARRVVRFPVG